MKKSLSLLVLAAALVLSVAGQAFALSSTIGNPAVQRASVDTFQNFTIVDTNHPAPFDGTIEAIDYFAHRAGAIRFVLVDSADEVIWVSEVVDVVAAGPARFETDGPVGLTAGSNLGVYSEGAGVISYDRFDGAAPAPFEENDSGLPAVGETLDFVDDSPREYSMNASVVASSPAPCKNGGWETYGYKNQGQCIASVVANEHSGK